MIRSDFMPNLLMKPDKKIGKVEYYNTKSISKILDLDPITIRTYFRRNYLTGVKFGNSWYLSKGDLEFFIVNGKLKKRENLDYREYKTLEADLITDIEKNLKNLKAQIDNFQRTQTEFIKINLVRRYNETKEALEEYKKDKMTKKDFEVK